MSFRVGAHLSIARGLPWVVDRQEEIGGNCGQIFVGSPRTWSVSQYSSETTEEFRSLRSSQDQNPYAVHATYLINLASPKADLRAKSVDCLQSEIDAAAQLEIQYVVVHPGAHTGSGAEAGMNNIAAEINRLTIPDGVMLLLENTAGKGTTLGRSVEELQSMLAAADQPTDSLGICIDTCHAHAAGYELRKEAEFNRFVREIDDEIGIDRVKLLHLNDSKDSLGSCKDNHEHIGDGAIGREGFRNVVNAPAFRDLPMVIETPKEDDESDPTNISILRSLRS